MLTPEEKKEIKEQVDEFVTNVLGPIEPEDLEEAENLILQKVEEQLDFIVTFHELTK